MAQPRHTDRTEGRGRAFRGLALVFTFSFLNLVGLILTTTVLGGLAPWTGWQFVGAFGVLEAASGLANVVSPNIWHLPVVQLRASSRTRARLAASTILLPHWGGLARFAAGAVCMVLAARHEGLAPASLGLLPLVLALAGAILAISAVAARLGVARPELDVVQLVVRWRGREIESRPISIGAAVIQFLLAIATIPAVKLLPPSVLYQPEFAPSGAALATTVAAAVALAVLAAIVWHGRIGVAAPAEQQREAREHA